MNFKRAKILIATATIASSATLLVMAGMSKDWVYYLPVDEYMAESGLDGRRVRLHGVVGHENVEVRPAELVATFELHGETSMLPVRYSGVVPDQFQPDREVVVEGTVGIDGIMHADTLLTKCSSKYESSGEAPHADPRAPESEV